MQLQKDFNGNNKPRSYLFSDPLVKHIIFQNRLSLITLAFLKTFFNILAAGITFAN